jgi:cytochrome c553
MMRAGAIGIGLLGLLAGPACDQAPEKPAVPPATEEARERTGPTEVEMVASMEGHYGVVILAHDALLQGDLEAFRRQLELVPEQRLPASAPASWQPYSDRLGQAAQRGASAGDLDAAAAALGQVVLACGACHEALDSGPVYPAPAPDDGETPVETAMLDHQWATERLWEGVTGPWDNAWTRGAEALANVRVFGELVDDDAVGPELREREEALREIGRAALVTEPLAERAALYGRLLATCGECHRLVGVEFAPPPGP